MRINLACYSVQPDCSVAAYLNYLHRQLYVMDTYATPHNRAINHTMAAIHSYLSAAFVAAIAAGVCTPMHHASYHHLDQPPGTTTAIWQVAQHALGVTASLPLPSVCLAASLLTAQAGLYWMTTRLCALWAVMLPQPPADVGQFDWCKVRAGVGDQRCVHTAIAAGVAGVFDRKRVAAMGVCVGVLLSHGGVVGGALHQAPRTRGRRAAHVTAHDVMKQLHSFRPATWHVSNVMLQRKLELELLQQVPLTAWPEPERR